VNRYTKLIKSLKEAAPNNSMSGVYSLNAPGHRVGPKDPPERFLPDINGDFTDGIPGNPGDPYYERPEGYWNGGKQWTETEVPDASQDYLSSDPTGKSTNDLIDEDGTVKTSLPPNSRHFILGPLVDGYVVNHGYDNYSNIGYLQKDTRQFVLLARIQGQFTADLHQSGARVWDGTAEQLTIYNSNFTLEMAEWFREQITEGRSTSNVPYFYSGGVPQQPLNILQCPECPPNMFGGVTPGTGSGFGRGTPPSLGTLQEPSESGNQQQAKIFNLTPDQVRTLAILLGLGLSIAAVIAILFPEPASSAAGAGYLASKFRFAAGLKKSLGQLWKAKPKTYKKIEYPKPSADEILLRNVNRATQRPVQRTTRTNAESPKKRFPVGDSYDHITDIEQKLIFEKFLNENAPTESGAGGGTELADVYVDQVSQDYDADQLQQASDDANDLAGDKGLTDKQKSDIDKEAEDLAKELNNVDYYKVESWSREQIQNFYDMAYSTDPEWLEQNFAKYEDLIDKESSLKAYDDYKAQREYLSSEEYYRTYPDYAESKDLADSLWPYVSQLEFKWDVPYQSEYSSGTANIAYLNGVEVDTWEDGWGALIKWGEAFQAHSDVYNNVISPAKEKALATAEETYRSISDEASREFNIAMINAWNQRNANVNDDPYGLEEIPRGNATYDAASELAMLGISAVVLKALIKTVGATKAATLMKTKEGLTKIKAWWNKGRNVRVPGENQASWKTLRADDKAQGSKFVKKGSRGKDNLTDADFEGGAIPTNLDQLGQLLQGKGGFTWQLTRGLGTGPTALSRQLIERPFRTIMKFFESSYLKGDLLTEETSDQKALYDALDAALKETDPKDFEKVIDKFLSMMEDQISQKEPMESYKPKFRRNREPLTETRTPKQRRILREIKQPVKVKESPTKYKMNFSGKYSPQNTPSATSSPESDALVASGNEKGRKWREEDKYWSGYETTERMNVIHDRVGHGSQYWDRMLDEAKEKNNWRTREMQEELNKIAHEKAMLKENPEYRSPFGDGVEVEDTTTKNVQNFEKVTKIKKVVADTKFFNNKEIKPEYPDEENRKKDMMARLAKRMSPEIEKNKKEYSGSKAQTGENAAARYKRLDPVSARSMPDAGYPQIDAFRDQAKKKPK